jgi:hypothetical protein
MSENVILWLFGILITLQTTVLGAVIAAIWRHGDDCRDFRTGLATAVADIKAKLERVERDIGTHETGLRGQVHKLASEITPLAVWAQMEQRYSERREHQRRIQDEREDDSR